MWFYINSMEVFIDVLRLLKGMIYKVVMVNIVLGGGKFVIIGDLR